MKITVEVRAVNGGYRVDRSVSFDGETEGQLSEIYALLDKQETERRERIWTKGEHGYFTGSISTGGGSGSGGGQKPLDKSAGSGIIKSRNIDDRKMANGKRRDCSYILTTDDIAFVTSEAEAIEIPPEVLSFNTGKQTGFRDSLGIINIRGDVFPDESSSINRDTLSVRAVLAHEYYGHYKSHPSPYAVGDWRDEFQASYNAAINTPNLSHTDRSKLILDAYDRAREAGVFLEYDQAARRIIYDFRFD